MESTFESLVEAGIDRNQFWELEEKDFANMGHNMGTRLRFRKGKKERAEILKTMQCKIELFFQSIKNRLDDMTCQTVF